MFPRERPPADVFMRHSVWFCNDRPSKDQPRVSHQVPRASKFLRLRLNVNFHFWTVLRGRINARGSGAMHKGGGAAGAARFLWLLTAVLAFAFGPAPAMAQTDEIQVYDGGVAPVGVFNLTWHNNYAVNGIKEPAFPGALISNHTYNGVTEWAYGVTPWFEQGLYFPLYSYSSNQGWVYNGWKLRELFAVPDADNRMFVYAVNFEFSFNQKQWDEKR